MLFGSILVLAIDCGYANMASIPSNSESEYVTLNSLHDLDDDGFWGKFRDSVMKDREGNDPNTGEPSRGGEVGGHDRGNEGHDGRGDHGGDGGHGGADHR